MYIVNKSKKVYQTIIIKQ